MPVRNNPGGADELQVTKFNQLAYYSDASKGVDNAPEGILRFHKPSPKVCWCHVLGKNLWSLACHLRWLWSSSDVCIALNCNCVLNFSILIHFSISSGLLSALSDFFLLQHFGVLLDQGQLNKFWFLELSSLRGGSSSWRRGWWRIRRIVWGVGKVGEDCWFNFSLSAFFGTSSGDFSWRPCCKLSLCRTCSVFLKISEWKLYLENIITYVF